MTRRIAVFGGALVLLLSCSLLSLAPAASAKTPKAFAGMNFWFWAAGQPSTNDPAVSPQDANLMRRGGVGSVRFGLDWSWVERAEGVYDYTYSDYTIGNLAANGIEALPVLWGTPMWAAKQGYVPPGNNYAAEPPTRNGAAPTQAWQNFLRWVVGRYGPRGSYWNGPYQAQHPGAKPMPVHTWQVWNEPNTPGLFVDPSAKAYATLLRVSHVAIKGADPSARIAIGGLPCRLRYTCVAFLKNLYKQPNVKSTFDIVALHPYGPTVGFVLKELRKARKTMKRHHDGRTPIWVGEVGWGSGTSGHYNEGLKGQKKLTARMYPKLVKARRKLHLWRVSWFDWRDPQTPLTKCGWCAYAGLFDSSYKPKPAWHAFRHAVKKARTG